jgi:hypothetical protein
MKINIARLKSCTTFRRISMAVGTYIVHVYKKTQLFLAKLSAIKIINRATNYFFVCFEKSDIILQVFSTKNNVLC